MTSTLSYANLYIQQKGMIPFIPSSLDILSDRRPAKQTLYDPLRYGVLSSDDFENRIHMFFEI